MQAELDILLITFNHIKLWLYTFLNFVILQVYLSSQEARLYLTVICLNIQIHGMQLVPCKAGGSVCMSLSRKQRVSAVRAWTFKFKSQLNTYQLDDLTSGNLSFHLCKMDMVKSSSYYMFHNLNSPFIVFNSFIPISHLPFTISFNLTQSNSSFSHALHLHSASFDSAALLLDLQLGQSTQRNGPGNFIKLGLTKDTKELAPRFITLYTSETSSWK